MDIHLGGTYRSLQAIETLKNIQPLIKRAGITRIAKLTHLDTVGLPVYTCIRPLSHNLSTSQGKGITDELAMCSAYMEGIETYFSEIVSAGTQASSPDFKQHKTVALSDLMPGYFNCTTPASRIKDWTAMTNLSTKEYLWVPTEVMRFSLTTAALENGLFKKTTTGLASGNTFEEAMSHALFEIIERNAQSEFNALPAQQKFAQAVDVNTVNYEEAAKLIQHIKSKDIDIALFDMTNKFGYPTYSAIIADNSPFRQLGHYAGAGTHADKGIAVCRALTEAVQSRLTYIAGSRDDMFPKDYHTKWQPLNIQGQLDYTKLPTKPLNSIKQQLKDLQQTFSTLKLDILFHEHTSDSDPVSVVKCIVPRVII